MKLMNELLVAIKVIFVSKMSFDELLLFQFKLKILHYNKRKIECPYIQNLHHGLLEYLVESKEYNIYASGGSF